MTKDEDHKHNFHTHTYRCKHAQGDIADYCEEAIRRNMKTLGFSDHSALPDDRWIQARMSIAELPEYAAAIDKAKEDYPQLRILKSMECEYIPKFRSWYEDELLGEHQFDYLVGAAHFFTEGDKWHGTYGGTDSPERLRAFAAYTIEMMETGIFDFIAHPDLFGNCYPTWDSDALACSREILEAAADLDVGMEINALGLRKQAYRKPDNHFPFYPWLPFWEEATRHNIRVIINSDAHRPEDLQARTGQAQEFAAALDLTYMDPASIGTHQQIERV